MKASKLIFHVFVLRLKCKLKTSDKDVALLLCYGATLLGGITLEVIKQQLAALTTDIWAVEHGRIKQLVLSLSAKGFRAV